MHGKQPPTTPSRRWVRRDAPRQGAVGAGGGCGSDDQIALGARENARSKSRQKSPTLPPRTKKRGGKNAGRGTPPTQKKKKKHATRPRKKKRRIGQIVWESHALLKALHTRLCRGIASLYSPSRCGGGGSPPPNLIDNKKRPVYKNKNKTLLFLLSSSSCHQNKTSLCPCTRTQKGPQRNSQKSKEGPKILRGP